MGGHFWDWYLYAKLADSFLDPWDQAQPPAFRAYSQTSWALEVMAIEASSGPYAERWSPRTPADWECEHIWFEPPLQWEWLKQRGVPTRTPPNAPTGPGMPPENDPTPDTL